MLRTSSVCGLILAAGLSSRMGDFKPLMPFKGKALIESTIDSMLAAGVKQIVIVLGYREMISNQSFAFIMERNHLYPQSSL
ncbi:MAG: NTP transferase domain-containing protein [Lacrimispora sp.]